LDRYGLSRAWINFVGMQGSWNRFLTLTLQEHRNWKYGRQVVNKFLRDLLVIDGKLKYFVSEEEHQDGAPHYHGLLETDIPAHAIQDFWVYGISKIGEIASNREAIAYCIKYMSKGTGYFTENWKVPDLTKLFDDSYNDR